MLTKSLHTVTAATNVARLLLQTADKSLTGDLGLARAALTVLGYSDVDVSRDTTDETVQRIVKACAKLLDERKTVGERVRNTLAQRASV
jgi:hypothetical protein